MKTPVVRYLVASPSGDVPVDAWRLDFPLEGDPLKTPYRIYFQAITDVISKNNFKMLLDAVNIKLGTDFGMSSLNEIIVRTEKHGALSHPASIECLLQDRSVKFALPVAVTETGKESLRREFNLLKALRSRFDLPYLPKPYYLDELNSMVFLLEEWFEGYHEFHIALTEKGIPQLKLWEHGRGDRFLSTQQSFEIYRQAAFILTLFYDLDSFRLIYPWHHAAGDFVARIEKEEYSPATTPSSILPLHNSKMGGITAPIPLAGEGRGEGYIRDKIDVRLTTVRGYEPFMDPDSSEMISPVLALFYFFLHLSIQMRLDKLDGVGHVVWADDSCVGATVTGFFEGLKRKSEFRDCCGSVRSFQMLLKSFTREDLKKTAVPIAEQFELTSDFRVIQEHLGDHVGQLYITLQNFPE